MVPALHWYAEVAAAVGLTLPGVTRIHSWLVTSAACGIMIVITPARHECGHREVDNRELARPSMLL